MKPALLPGLLLALLLGGCASPRGGGGDDDDSRDDDDSGGDDDDSVDDDDNAGPGAIDLLIVMDNSNSMERLQSDWQASISALVDPLRDAGIDLQVGVVTTDVEAQGPGNQGILRGSGPVGGQPDCGTPLIVGADSPNFVGELSGLLDVGVVGAGSERGIQAAVLALCRAQDAAFWTDLAALPADDALRLACEGIPSDTRDCNAGLLREGAATAVLIISDEGDDTERNEQIPTQAALNDCVLANNNDPTFGGCDCRLEAWVGALQALDATVFAMGPSYQDINTPAPWCTGPARSIPGPCNAFGNTVCSLDFYQQGSCLTGGEWWPVEENVASQCELADLGPITTELVAALQSL